MYAQILHDISSKDQFPSRQPQAIRLLQFLAFSERPLTIEEAVDALAVNLSEWPSFRETNRMPRVEEITQYCPSLVTLRRSCDSNNPVHTVQLAHTTVKEYLMSDEIDQDWGRHFRESQARLSILQVNLAYAEFMWEKDPFNDQPFSKELYLSNYMKEFLFAHARVADNESEGANLLAGFLQRSSALKAWTCRFSPATSKLLKSGTYSEMLIPSAMFLAAHFGLEQTMRLLIGRCVMDCLFELPISENLFGFFESSPETRRYVSPLYAAAEAGYTGISKLLVKSAPSVKVLLKEHGGKHGSALHVACYENHDDIVLFFLEQPGFDNAEMKEVFQQATSFGSLKIVEKLFKQGLLLKKGEAQYEAGLYRASRQGHADLIRAILRHSTLAVSCPMQRSGTNMPSELKISSVLPDSADRTVPSALHVASFAGHKEVVQALLDSGIDINTVDHVSGIALQAAVVGGHEDVVTLLLDRRSEINHLGGICGSALRAALEAASRSSEFYKARNLLRNKYNRLPRDGRPTNPRHYSYGAIEVKHCDEQIVLNLLHRGALPRRGQQDLRVALDLHNEDIVLRMIAAVDQHDPDVRHYDTLETLFCPGENLIFKAISRGFARVVDKMLSENPDDIQLRSEGSETTLHHGAKFGSHSVFKTLVSAALPSHKELFTTRDDNGMMPLHVAALHGNSRMVKTLYKNRELSSYIDEMLQSVDNCGRTGLHFAASGEHGKLLTSLLLLGCDPRAQDTTGMTYLDYAKRAYGYDITPRWYEDLFDISFNEAEFPSAPQDQAVFVANTVKLLRRAEIGDWVAVEAVLDTAVDGLSINARSQHGRTALHLAVQDGSHQMVQYFLAFGADVNVHDSRGMTPLHYAAENDNVALLDALVRGGALPNLTNKSLRIPLQCAIHVGADAARKWLEENTESRNFQVNIEEYEDRTPEYESESPDY